MEEFRGAFEIVLAITIRFGIPVIMLFLLGCGIKRTDWLLRVVSRLLGESEQQRKTSSPRVESDKGSSNLA